MQKDSRHHERDDEEEFEFPSPPVASDGGIAPGYGLIGRPADLPPWTADHAKCLQGPCRHYWHLVTSAGLGNPKGTFEEGKEPREHHHTCLVNPGYETSLQEDMVYECSRWEPAPDVEIERLTTARETYYQRHPEHRPKAVNNDDSSISQG